MSASTKTTNEFQLRFAPSDAPQGKYKLLELPQELCKVVESGLETQFTIRGRPNDDAVLCTASRTYALRAVTLSNTIVVATAPDPATSNDDETLELIVQDQVSQILELVPTVPKLHRLDTILKGCEYDEGHERDDEGGGTGDEMELDPDEDLRAGKRAKFTKDSVRGEIQASDEELSQGFKQFHILDIEGHLRPLSPSFLTQILETILTALVSQGLPLPPNPVPIDRLTHHLDLEHEMPRLVTEQILPWFGVVNGNNWEMDPTAAVKQVGLGRLMTYKNDPPTIEHFLDQWRTAVGDVFASIVDIALLEGNYLLSPAPPTQATHLVYFPSSALPITATALFTDLFLTRPRWRAVDIAPFLGAVAVDKKEQEKLLMKYARTTTDAAGGVWYTARATHV
ncbi:sister chromatid cohesion protein Dcc1 [Hysterangium stoloniferum]|nr:sister chromatid cohesion protein Dcc1 [Hysterangium stoloniferum]